MKSKSLLIFIGGIILLFSIVICNQSGQPETSYVTPTVKAVIPTRTQISASPTPWPKVDVGVVQVDALNIRSGPGTVFSIIGSLKKQDEFYILADMINYDQQKWLLIVIDDSSYGWVIGEKKFVTQKEVLVSYDTYLLLKSTAIRARTALDQQLTQSSNLQSNSIVVNDVTPEQAAENSTGDGGASGGSSSGGTGGGGGGSCDPHYPTVCIPSPPPDLDCGDIPYTWFQVLPGDPHRFDADQDGWGCEN